MPIAAAFVAHETDTMANDGVGEYVDEMLARHLDGLVADMSGDLLQPDQGSATSHLLFDADGHLVVSNASATRSEAAAAAQLTRQLHPARSSGGGEQPVLLVAVRRSGDDRVAVGVAIVDVARLSDEFAEPLQLEDFSITPRPADDPTRAVRPINWGTRSGEASISWKRDRTGTFLLQQIAPLLILLIVAVAGSAVILLRRVQRLVRGVFAARERAEHLALHDGLTGVGNRLAFMHSLETAMARHRRGVEAVGILMIDLDRFKLVNDTFGHQAGDELIIKTARRLKAARRTGDTVARFGGDEFAIVAAAPDGAGLHAFASRLVGQLQDSVPVTGGMAELSGSVGLSVMDDTVADSAEMLRRTDLALHAAKRAGRGQHRHFEAA